MTERLLSKIPPSENKQYITTIVGDVESYRPAGWTMLRLNAIGGLNLSVTDYATNGAVNFTFYINTTDVYKLRVEFGVALQCPL